MRLAYQDLSVQRKRQEDRLRQVDPKKAEQVERLGMGAKSGGAGGISHSTLTEMSAIEQEEPRGAMGGGGGRSLVGAVSSRRKDFEDDDDDFGGFRWVEREGVKELQ